MWMLVHFRSPDLTEISLSAGSALESERERDSGKHNSPSAESTQPKPSQLLFPVSVFMLTFNLIAEPLMHHI